MPRLARALRPHALRDIDVAGDPAVADARFDIEPATLLAQVHERWQHDFRGYAPASLHRRLAVAMDRLTTPRLSELRDVVLRDAAAFAVLLQCLTITVSAMFRDPPYFRAVRERIVPLLATYPSIRVWVAGCGRGEEAWSLAVLLREAGLLERSRIYATDINPKALERAAAGVYPLSKAAAYARNYLQSGGRGSLLDHAEVDHGRLRMSRALGERIVFAEHSLATDAVFAEVQFVSCRNVLIYFGAALHERAVALFRDALVRGGFVGLGAEESLDFGDHRHVFESLAGVEPGVRLYRRR